MKKNGNDMLRSYSELIQHDSFEDRFTYLRLNGSVGADTFGFDRYINQQFYRSTQWKQIRTHVIARDEACDLGVFGHDIFRAPLIHHMNPMTPQDIIEGADWILDPEFLITTTTKTHNAIHYGVDEVVKSIPVTRTAGDTRLW